MSTTVDTAAEIRPFRVEIPGAALDGLRRRITTTRWPSKELVDDRSQGVQLATARALATYWLDEYDFGPIERRLNALPRWVEKSYPNVIYFNEVNRGGHFAAFEEPELFGEEVRAAFRPLRNGREP
jgi:hypothetical protein